jgi:protein-L-isoaspartate(D-aspartate) O-methyltransferase
VLEIGSGSGYQTAILARLARRVYAIERIGALTDRARRAAEGLGLDNIEWRVGDGSLGWPDHAPFDRILCAAAGPGIPDAWREQLADGGRLVTPVGPARGQQIVRLDRRGEQFERINLLAVRFVPLIGEQAWPDGPAANG